MARVHICIVAIGTTLAAGIGGADANPITVTDPFLQLYNVGDNSLGAGPGGPFIRFGATKVVPNGASGTVGSASTIDANTGKSVTRTIPFNPGPVIPDFFSRNIPYASGLLGPWTLTFTNGPDVFQKILTLPVGAVEVPFVNSITLSGSAANPTFTWTPPVGVTVNGYRLNIYDKSLIGPGDNGDVVSLNLLPNFTSHTVQAADFTVPGYSFALNKNYSIEIDLLQTRDGSSANLTNFNVFARSLVFADFTPKAGGGPVVNLPVTLINGSFQFNISVVPGQVYFIDPPVAVGYDYQIGAGNPDFRSVLLPTGIGDNEFDIYGFDALGHRVLLVHDWLGGQTFDFGALGVSRFEVGGIEASAGLDPADTTAFVTGLTFTGAGMFTGTQTPITANAVPEPASLLLFGAGLAGLGLIRRGRSAPSPFPPRT